MFELTEQVINNEIHESKLTLAHNKTAASTLTIRPTRLQLRQQQNKHLLKPSILLLKNRLTLKCNKIFKTINK